MTAAYLALAYAAIGAVWFVFLMAYFLFSPNSPATNVEAIGPYSPFIVGTAIALFLVFCLLVWPLSMRNFRRDLVRRRRRPL